MQSDATVMNDDEDAPLSSVKSIIDFWGEILKLLSFFQQVIAGYKFQFGILINVEKGFSQNYAGM